MGSEKFQQNTFICSYLISFHYDADEVERTDYINPHEMRAEKFRKEIPKSYEDNCIWQDQTADNEEHPDVMSEICLGFVDKSEEDRYNSRLCKVWNEMKNKN